MKQRINTEYMKSFTAIKVLEAIDEWFQATNGSVPLRAGALIFDEEATLLDAVKWAIRNYQDELK
jgi:hypothetical protein